MNPYSIVITSLCKSYNKHLVLRGLNLSVNDGEIYGIIGKNGAGKSTMVDCLLGMKKADSGSIAVLGMDIAKKPMEIKKNIGYVASEPSCYSSMKGIEFCNFIASVYAVPQATYAARLQELMGKLDFSSADMQKYIAEYSHGMKQKVCLIASLLHDPKLWILDEPTVGLDVMTAEAVRKIMEEKKAKGDTVLFISHNIEYVLSVCDKVGVLHDGVIAKEYGKEELSNQKERILQEFFDLVGEGHEGNSH